MILTLITLHRIVYVKGEFDMEDNELFATRKKTARLAGLGYLVLAFAALPDMFRSALIIAGDHTATAKNILDNVTMFRISILGDFFTELAFLLMAICLYSLLKEVHRGAARTMLSMVAIAVTMVVLNTGFEIAAIRLFENNDPVNGFLMLGIFQAHIVPKAFFFGLWMMPLGYLFFKSSFMPKTLGAALMIGSSGYIVHAIFALLAPGVTEYFTLLSVIAEVATLVWLLGFGVKRPSPK